MGKSFLLAALCAVSAVVRAQEGNKKYDSTCVRQYLVSKGCQELPGNITGLASLANCHCSLGSKVYFGDADKSVCGGGRTSGGSARCTNQGPAKCHAAGLLIEAETACAKN
ncbi:MAG: hypothetical protein LBT92_01295 [Rickettsiales bacterium]|jgi:hypothetical protein|nr:hypothetical protein [Rickettsiales bacterium]